MPRPENSVSGSVRERSENCLKLNVGKRQETERPVQRNVESREDLIRIDGGIGIGRVTKPGLDQPVGAAAINSVPRKMIRDAVYALLEEAGELFPVSITISIPAGVKLQRRPSILFSASRVGSPFSGPAGLWSP